MKAVILAGGKGAGLRPLSLERPAAMLPVLGRPLMEHILLLLREQGITRVWVAPGEGFRELRDTFGGGGELRMELTYVGEEGMPSKLGEKDILLVPGNCLFDLDMKKLMDFHRERRSAVTMGLCPSSERTARQSMAITGPEGRVERLAPASPWGGGLAGFVDTGLWVVTPGILRRLWERGSSDLEEGLSELLREDTPVWGCPLDGYWRKLEDTRAYLDGVCDALSGKVRLDPGLPQREPGIWSAQAVPEGVSLVPPCWLGPEVQVEPGSL